MLRAQVITALIALAGSSASGASEPLELSIAQLSAAPQQFNGKRVSVTGYFDTVEHHACDIHPTKRRPHDLKHVIQIDVTESMDPALKRLTRDYTRLLYVHVVGTFQFRDTSKQRVISQGDATHPGIIEATAGFGWMGIYDKQITKISKFSVLQKE